MKFTDKVYREIKRLSQDEKYAFFFDKMKEDTDPVTDEVLDKLADLLTVECSIPWEDLPKVKFFLELACGASR